MKFKKTYGQYTFTVESVNPNFNPENKQIKEIYIDIEWLNPVRGGGRHGSTESSSVGVNYRIDAWLGDLIIKNDNGGFEDHPKLIDFAIKFAKEAKKQDYFN